MSVSYAPTKLRVPLGFDHLLEALSREVLREQPKDIINFAAEYFRRKLILRDGETTYTLCNGSKARWILVHVHGGGGGGGGGGFWDEGLMRINWNNHPPS